MHVLANTEEYDPEGGDQDFRKFSFLQSVNIDETRPTDVSMHISHNKLEDQSSSQFFNSIGPLSQQPSSWKRFPTWQAPESLYKFAGLEVSMSLDRSLVREEYYGFLDFLSDQGGLLIFLFVLGQLLVMPFT